MLAAASIRFVSTPIADRAIAAYVQGRLQQEYESQPRGYMASLARKVSMSTAHLANAKNKGSVGGDLAQALAKAWGMTWEELRAAAGVATASERCGARPAHGRPSPRRHLGSLNRAARAASYDFVCVAS